MKLKNRNGSTLALTLIVFAVLMILGTFILGFMVTENRQAMYHQNKTQAYYIARSGAEIVEAALTTKLRDLFDENGIKGVNDYIKELELLDESDKFVTLNNNLGGIDSLKISIEDVDGDEVLVIYSAAIYNGVHQSIRKVMWSNLTTTSSKEKLIKYEGAPIVAIKEAWRTDKGKTDLSDPSKNNGKTYAEIVGENSIFKPYKFPIEPIWGAENMEPNEIVLSGVTIDENKNYNGNVTITGNLKIVGKVNINIRGTLKLDNTLNINNEVGSLSENLSFHIYNKNNSSHALITSPAQGGVIKGNFYINQGKADINLKKAYLEGSIISNDKYKDNEDNISQDNFNVRILAEDSSNKINFNGSIYAPDAYVLVGGNLMKSEKNAILQDGMILGRFVEVEGNNHKKNFDFLDFILEKAQDGTTLPVDTEIDSNINVLKFYSYFTDVNN